METFPTCEQQVLWISLGSARWQEEVGPTVGALDRPIEGVMPGFAGELSDEQIAQVAAYERARFGGAAEEAMVEECVGSGD